MAKYKYDKNLDEQAVLAEQAVFYDRADIDEYLNVSDKTKRININISVANYDIAKKISALSGIGYQNTLKMAMSIGLAKLLQEIVPKKQ